MPFATAGFAADQAMQRMSGSFNVYFWVQRSDHCISEGTASSSPLRQVDGAPISVASRCQLLVELLQQSGVSKCGDGGVSMLGDGGVSMLSDGGVSMLSDGGVSMLSDGGNHATCHCVTTVVHIMLTRQLLYRPC